MSYDLLDRVYSIMIDVMTGVSAGSGNAVFYNTDSHTSFIEVSITNGTQSFNMSEYNYQLVISKPDKTGYNNSYTTTDNSKLVIALDSDMLSGIGNNIAQLYVMKTINDVSKVVTMIEFNYTVKAGNYSALAPESVNHDSMYIALRTDVDSILSKIENGELGGGSGSGLTATQAEQLATAYEHSQSPHITTADVNNAVSTYVTAHKEELKGAKGDKGDTGATGAKGEKGDTGAKGDKGEKGDTGATGANGITPTLKVGSTSTGNAGTNASVTMTDNNNVYTLNFVIPKGEKGDTGAKGDAGVKGQDGAKGADGITPTLKVGTVTTLAAGSNATVTMSKNNNEYTLNFGIPKGNKGDTGASGGSGETTVVNPTITIGTVTNGDTASATITGDSPNYTLNLVLPKGDKGDTGAKGDAGTKGADGITPTIAVGTTTTGEAGTNANVTMSKSGTTYTFNFVIPKGAKGDTGVAGTKGDKGDKGDPFTYADFTSEQLAALKGAKGDKGDKGDTGAKGDKGDPFTYADFTSEQLAALKGAKGDKGDKGDTGADGAKGDKGDTGAKGEKGADGVTPTFTIGTITTGAAGSTATVTITGTAPNYVLNFTIPKGDKGDKGDTGASGSGGSGGIAFEDTYVSDANLWLTNGYTKTSGTSTINLPSVCTNTKDKWGILFFIAENARNGTGTQMFFPIDGVYKGKIFTRSIVNRTEISSWIMLASKDDIIEAVNGTNGATFTPTVDSEGNLSWSNDKNLANPNTVNIKGAKGDKGEKGDTGAKGADGQTPNISIGTVTTGAAGSSASAEITGTTPNLTLNLTIPKGDKGDTGAAGSGGTVTKTVKVLTSSASVTLTTDEYQYLEGNRDMSITLPTVSTSTDVTILHLFYVPNAARTLTFSDSTIHWQNSTPTIEANKYYEFIFTRTHKGAWLAGVVVYG